MPDVRDAEDALNLQTGDFAALLAPYLEIIHQRCLIAVRDGQGEDVAQNVYLRLLREHQAGRRYRVPYRVVVHKVVDWTIKAHFQACRRTSRSPTTSSSPATRAASASSRT